MSLFTAERNLSCGFSFLLLKVKYFTALTCLICYVYAAQFLGIGIVDKLVMNHSMLLLCVALCSCVVNKRDWELHIQYFFPKANFFPQAPSRLGGCYSVKMLKTWNQTCFSETAFDIHTHSQEIFFYFSAYNFFFDISSCTLVFFLSSMCVTFKYSTRRMFFHAVFLDQNKHAVILIFVSHSPVSWLF